ncbi:uncharacterized protein LOC123535364 [Mercenaria mercenaria]|uniref:uncharacterized protein LOC123535364 n=1 Tax=Mercenaria mercenaria TaxID=6596 RepID=UPI00234F21F8|nr:uncharacterized protein LOC123535364 [Mercenaria mercenaria]
MKYFIFSVFFCCQLLDITAGSEKRGLVHRLEEYKCGDFDTLSGIVWWYDYRNDISYFLNHDDCSTSLDYNTTIGYVPMVWGAQDNPHIQSDSTYCLGFNEPNHPNQANLTSEAAAAGWRELEAAANGIKLVSPSASECGGPSCIDSTKGWFDGFFSECANCTIDFIATHTYMCDAEKVMSILEDLYTTYNKTVWLTEFACGKIEHPELMLIFMKQILPLLEAADYVYRYSWYKGRIPYSNNGTAYVTPAASLLEPNGTNLTTLGEFYTTYQYGDTVNFGDISIPVVYPSGVINETAAQQNVTEGTTKAEVEAIFDVYDYNPTVWWKVLHSIRSRFNDMPWQVGAFYMTVPKIDAKVRIKAIFKIFWCINLSHILDDNLA